MDMNEIGNFVFNSDDENVAKQASAGSCTTSVACCSASAQVVENTEETE